MARTTELTAFDAQRILEKTLGNVDGYQSDDGIVEHKCAISAVKKLYKQKPAKWSEEDESRMDNLCHFLEEYGNQYYGYLTLQDTISWLKSLRPQSQWKPSKEQMETLKYACGGNYVNLGILESLYQELKKLKG